MTLVAVVGAGPAGLAAARSARRARADVVLLDTADQLGGQYWRHLPDDRPAERPEALQHGWRRFRRLADDLRDDDRCRILTSAQVWAIERSETGVARVHVLLGPTDGTARERLALDPDSLVLATGAYDRILPFPGWTLPGVFTAGAGQALAKGERVALGRRVVVAGAGPFLLPVAASLAATGARVVGVHEASGTRALARGWLSRPQGLAGAPGKSLELAGYVAGQLRRRIPYRTSSAVVAAHGGERVEAVTVARLRPDWSVVPGSERRIAADAVCVGHGFTPRLELPIAAGCAIGPDRFVVVDDEQGTSVAGVYAAGEITGIGGVDAALAEGEIAGHGAAGARVDDAAVLPARRRRAVYRDFARRIDAAHGIRPGWTSWLADDTVVCRCEEVGYGRLRDTAAASTAGSLRALTLGTRAGLGICQARICGRTVEDLTRRVQGEQYDGTSLDRRPISGLIRLGELAADARALDDTPLPSKGPSS